MSATIGECTSVIENSVVGVKPKKECGKPLVDVRGALVCPACDQITSSDPSLSPMTWKRESQ
jgi:hypothetical protein